MRLSELACVQSTDINWENQTITIIGKGNKQRKAPFTNRTVKFMKNYLDRNSRYIGNMWGINQYGIQKMLNTLGLATGIKCNPHVFRRTFACILHKKGLSTLSIMHLGGWESLDMVLRYTRSITFDDCLEQYKQVDIPL